MVRVRTGLRYIFLAAVTFLVVVAGFLIPAGSASASPAADASVSESSIEMVLPRDNNGGYVTPGSNESNTLCDPNGERHSNKPRNCLPVYRWSGAVTEMYRNLPEGMGDSFDSAINASQIGALGLLFSFGSSMWETTVGLSEWATELNVIDTVGGVIDNGAAALGKAILLGPLAAVILVGVIIWGVWTAYRRGSFPIKNVFKAVALVAVGAAMINGASNTVQPENGGKTTFGTFSPGWIANTLNNTISIAGNGITSGLVKFDESDVGLVGITRGNNSNCMEYVQTLKNLYKNSKSGITDNALPVALNNIWEDTGLTSWASAQFGPAKSKDTPMAAYSYCMLAEWQANIPSGTIYSILKKSSDTPYESRSLAVSPWNTVEMAESLGGDEGDDPPATGNLSGDDLRIKRATAQSLIAWAACDWNGEKWVPRAGWSTAVGKGVGAFQDESQFQEDCGLWAKNEEGKQAGHYFNERGFQIQNTPDGIQKAVGGTDSRAAYQYVSSLFGYDKFNTGGMSAIMYAISAFVNMVVFGGLSLIVFLAKGATAVLLIALFPMMLVSMLPMFSNALSRFLKQFVGFSVFAWGYSLIVAIVVLIATIINRAGEALVGNYGSTFAMLISALSPAAALIMIAMLAKKVVGVNPLSPKTILGMAGVGGAIGAAGSNMLTNGWNQAKGRGKQAAKNKITGAGDPGGKGGLPGGGKGPKTGASGGMAGQIRGGGNKESLTDDQKNRRELANHAASWDQMTAKERRDAELETRKASKPSSDEKSALDAQRREQRKAAIEAQQNAMQDRVNQDAEKGGWDAPEISKADARLGLMTAAMARPFKGGWSTITDKRSDAKNAVGVEQMRIKGVRDAKAGGAHGRGRDVSRTRATLGLMSAAAGRGMKTVADSKPMAAVGRGAVRGLTGASTEAWKNASGLQRVGMGMKTGLRGAGFAAAGLGIAMTGGALAAPIAGVAAARTGFAARNAVRNPNSEYNQKRYRKLEAKKAAKYDAWVDARNRGASGNGQVEGAEAREWDAKDNEQLGDKRAQGNGERLGDTSQPKFPPPNNGDNPRLGEGDVPELEPGQRYSVDENGKPQMIWGAPGEPNRAEPPQIDENAATEEESHKVLLGNSGQDQTTDTGESPLSEGHANENEDRLDAFIAKEEKARLARSETARKLKDGYLNPKSGTQKPDSQQDSGVTPVNPTQVTNRPQAGSERDRDPGRLRLGANESRT